VWSAAFYVIFERAGYIVATSVYLLALMAWFNRGKWIANVMSAVLFSILSYVMFLKLDVRLPQGILQF
jgi:putative tricarboxylic transport membrane protein